MASARHGVFLGQIHRLFTDGTVAGLSEWQLLARYVSRRDEAAFEALVARHGPMVLGVCRRLLDDPNDVEDAFQATFLVLVKKAGTLGERDPVGHWLYGVAYRVALRARSVAIKRRIREAEDPEAVAMSPDREEPDREIRRVIDEELTRLPAKYRAPIVLCYGEGLTHEAAAEQLRWPLGTVKGRLARARQLLKGRLVRRGLAPSAGWLAASLSGDATAGVPLDLLNATVKASMQLSAGPIAAGTISASAALLLEGMLTSMSMTKLKILSLTVGACLLTASGVVVIAQQSAKKGAGDATVPSGENPGGPLMKKFRKADTAPPSDVMKAETPESIDRRKRELASRILERELAMYLGGERNDLATLLDWSKKSIEGLEPSDPTRQAQLRKHQQRAKTILEEVTKRFNDQQVPEHDLLIAQYYAADADRQLNGSRSRSSGQSGAGVVDPKTSAIFAELEEPISMSFPNPVPLEAVLKYVKAATTKPKTSGLPIYVDPEGLQVAKKTMMSPVQLDLEGLPLKTTLGLALKQVGLVYHVRNGLLTITHPSLGPPAGLLDAVEQAEKGELGVAEMEELVQKFKKLDEIRDWKEKRRKAALPEE